MGQFCKIRFYTVTSKILIICVLHLGNLGAESLTVDSETKTTRSSVLEPAAWITEDIGFKPSNISITVPPSPPQTSPTNTPIPPIPRIPATTAAQAQQDTTWKIVQLDVTSSMTIENSTTVNNTTTPTSGAAQFHGWSLQKVQCSWALGFMALYMGTRLCVTHPDTDWL